MRDYENNNRLIFTICLFILINIFNIIMGFISISCDNEMIYMLATFFVPLIVIPVVLKFCKSLGINYSEIGITSKNILKSFLLGFIICLCLLPFSKGLNLPTNASTIYIIIKFFQILIPVAILEEITFRGFISHSVIANNKRLSIVLSGILFSVSHIPFAAIVNHMGMIEYAIYEFPSLISIFIIHLLLQFIYDKYNNCVGAIIIHFFLDFFRLM